MKVQNSVLLDLEGEPLKQSLPGLPVTDEAPPLTLADVVTSVLLSRHQGQSPLSPAQNVTRWKLAKALADVAVDSDFVLPNELVPEIQQGLTMLYGPIVAGQAIDLLEGNK
jgi:hypothetical protein